MKEVNNTGGRYTLVKLQEYTDEFTVYFKNNKPVEAGRWRTTKSLQSNSFMYVTVLSDSNSPYWKSGEGCPVIRTHWATDKKCTIHAEMLAQKGRITYSLSIMVDIPMSQRTYIRKCEKLYAGEE